LTLSEIFFFTIGLHYITKLKTGAPFLSHLQKTIFQKQTNIAKITSNSTIGVKWVEDHFGVSIFHEDLRETTFTFLFPLILTFDLLTSDLFSSYSVQGRISTKFEVSTALRLRENPRHRTDGRTDGRQTTLNATC